MQTTSTGSQPTQSAPENRRARTGSALAAAALLVLAGVWLAGDRGPTPPVASGDAPLSPGETSPVAIAELPRDQAALGPRPPHRANPFLPNGEIRRLLPGPPPPERPLPGPVAPALPLYAELRPDPTTTPGLDRGEPPLPPMRVAAVIVGARTSAVLQIGERLFTVTPGQRVPEEAPVFRVDAIERERVVLSRRWEQRGIQRVQRVEIALSGAAGPGAGPSPASTPPRPDPPREDDAPGLEPVRMARAG